MARCRYKYVYDAEVYDVTRIFHRPNTSPLHWIASTHTHRRLYFVLLLCVTGVFKIMTFSRNFERLYDFFFFFHFLDAIATQTKSQNRVKITFKITNVYQSCVKYFLRKFYTVSSFESYIISIVYHIF